MKLIDTAATTSAINVGDVVIFSGKEQVVTELKDLGTPAMFGTGNDFNITLETAGRRTEMVAAASMKWNRV